MQVVDTQLLGDASGGNSVITINTDTRFESLITHVEIAQLGAAVAQNYQLQAFSRGVTPAYKSYGTLFLTDVVLGSADATWDPPPLIDTSQLVLTVDNVDGDTMLLAVWLYNFNVNASKTVPLNMLFESIPRAGITWNGII